MDLLACPSTQANISRGILHHVTGHPQPEQADHPEPEQSTPMGEIERAKAFIREHLAWVLGLAALLFACAGVLVPRV